MENKKTIWADLLQKWGYTKTDKSVKVTHEEVEDKKLESIEEDMQDIIDDTNTLPDPPQFVELPKDYNVDEYTVKSTIEDLNQDNIKDESNYITKTDKKETNKKAIKTKKTNKKK
jgi:hypothetical protein